MKTVYLPGCRWLNACECVWKNVGMTVKGEHLAVPYIAVYACFSSPSLAGFGFIWSMTYDCTTHLLGPMAAAYKQRQLFCLVMRGGYAFPKVSRQVPEFSRQSHTSRQLGKPVPITKDVSKLAISLIQTVKHSLSTIRAGKFRIVFAASLQSSTFLFH